MERLVGFGSMACRAVVRRVDGERGDRELRRGAQNAKCDLAPIGDEQLLVRHQVAGKVGRNEADGD